MSNKCENEEPITTSLLKDHTSLDTPNRNYIKEDDEEKTLFQRVWIETKKLWRVVGPAIFSRIVSYSMFVITQALAGHLGDLELAAMSIAVSVVIGFDFGLQLGMASALETLCGQAYGAKEYHMLGIYLQRSWIVLLLYCVLTTPIFFFAAPILKLVGQPADVADLSGVVAVYFIPLHFGFAMQFPLQRFLQSQLKNYVTALVNLGAFCVHLILSWLLVYRWRMGVVGTAVALNLSWWVIVLGMFCYAVCGGCPTVRGRGRGFPARRFRGCGSF